MLCRRASRFTTLSKENDHDHAPPIPQPGRGRARDAGASPACERAELAGEAADPGDDPVFGRQQPRHRRAHRARSALEPARTDDRGGEPRRRRRVDRNRRRRQGGSRRLFDPDQRLRAFLRPGGLSEHQLRSGARFFRGHPVRHHPQRDGDRARQGHQDDPAVGGRPPNRAPSPMPPRASAAPPIGRPSACASAPASRPSTFPSAAVRKRSPR